MKIRSIMAMQIAVIIGEDNITEREIERDFTMCNSKVFLGINPPFIALRCSP